MEKIQLLSRFNRTSGSVIYGNRTRKVMVPKLTGMALEGAGPGAGYRQCHHAGP
jgi:hypothetical protein